MHEPCSQLTYYVESKEHTNIPQIIHHIANTLQDISKSERESKRRRPRMNPADKARAQLHTLQKLPENRTCMDCGGRDPRWASVNLGIFICINCAGAHRTLGTHISIPKSLDQDNWTLEQVENIRKKGNANAKKYFEATMKSTDTIGSELQRVTSDTIALEKFIRRKYEYLEFTPKKPTGLSSSGNVRSARSATTSAPTKPIVLQSYESTRQSKDDSILTTSSDNTVPADYLTNNFHPRGSQGVNKADIMHLYDPKMKPTQAPPAPKSVAPPTPTYPAANYNVNFNPFPAHNSGSLSPTAPLSPYGNPGSPNTPHSPYGNPGSPQTPLSPYGNSNQNAYSMPPHAYGSAGIPLSSSFGAPPIRSSFGPDLTPPLPVRPPSFSASLPTLNSSLGYPSPTSSLGYPSLNASYGSTSLNSSYGSPYLASAHSAPLTSSYGAIPLSPLTPLSPLSPNPPHSPMTPLSPNPFATYGAPQNPSYQIPGPNSGAPAANYNPFTNPADPNYLATQFNFR